MCVHMSKPEVNVRYLPLLGLPRASLLIGLSGQQALECVFLCAPDPVLGFQMCKPGLAFTWVLGTQTQVPMLAYPALYPQKHL